MTAVNHLCNHYFSSEPCLVNSAYFGCFFISFRIFPLFKIAYSPDNAALNNVDLLSTKKKDFCVLKIILNYGFKNNIQYSLLLKLKIMKIIICENT
jgi:hypothetical protein